MSSNGMGLQLHSDGEPREKRAPVAASLHAIANRLWQVSGIVLLVYVACVFAGLVLLLAVRFDLSFPEGAVVARIRDVAQGRSPYSDWRLWPHAFAPYGPLTYYFPGGIAWLLLDPRELYPFYVLGRACSLLFLAGIWILLLIMARRLSVSWPLSLFALALFSSWTWVQEFALSCRPDAPQVFFALLAVVIAMRGRATPSRQLLVYSALMISCWFKPVSWGVSLAILSWAWNSTGWRSATIGFLCFLVSGLTASLALDHRFGGYLTLNMLGVADVGVKPASLLPQFSAIPLRIWCIWIIAIGIVGVEWRTGSADRALNVFLLAMPLSLLVAILQFGRHGADLNYFIASFGLACVLTVSGLNQLIRKARGPRLKFGVGALLMIGASFAASREVAELPGKIRRAQRLATSLPGLDDWKGEDQKVLAFHPYLSLTLGSEPSILDAFQYMVRTAHRDDLGEELLDRVHSSRFDLIIIPSDAELLYRPDFLTHLHGKYHAVGNLGPNSVYVPRNKKGAESDVEGKTESKPAQPR